MTDDRVGMLCEARQRHVDGRLAGADLLLLERREQRVAAGIGEGPLEGGVALGVRRDGEIDIEGDLPRAQRHQFVEDAGMDAARPRPDADTVEAGGVDVDEHRIAAGGNGGKAEALAAQRVVDRHEDAQQRRHDKQCADECHLQLRRAEDVKRRTQGMPTSGEP